MLYVVSSRERYCTAKSLELALQYFASETALFNIISQNILEGEGKEYSRLVSWCQPSDLLCWLTVTWPGAPTDSLKRCTQCNSILVFYINHCPQDQPVWDNERGHCCLLPHWAELPGRAGVSDIHLCWVSSSLVTLFVWLSFFITFFLSTLATLCLFSACLSACIFLLSVFLSFWSHSLSLLLSLFLSTYLSVCLTVLSPFCLFVWLFSHLSVCRSFCLSLCFHFFLCLIVGFLFLWDIRNMFICLSFRLSSLCRLPFIFIFVLDIVYPMCSRFVSIWFFIKVVFFRLPLTKGLSYSMSLCLGVLSIGTQLQQVYQYMLIIAHSYWTRKATCFSNGSPRLGIMLTIHQWREF